MAAQFRINKCPETMTGKERIKRTFAYEKTDRVPIGYEANDVIHANLKAALGLSGKDDEALYEAIGLDYRGVFPQYTGRPLFRELPGRRVHDMDGYYTRWIANESGGYWDYCDFPLEGAEDEDFAAFPVPNPDDLDYEAAAAHARSYDGKYALFCCHPGIPDVINSNGRLMGMEDVLCHLITGSEAALDFMNRRAKFYLGQTERTLEACGGLIDFLWLGEDLGTQIGPLVSLELYRSAIKPIHKMFADLAAAYNIPAIIHTCGCSSWAYEDMIEIGIKGVDTLQPEAKDMSPAYLAERFGGRLNFRGCISTAGALTYGAAEEVRDVCAETLEIMMKPRGYHFAPTHQIQDNTPVENVVAMYQAAHDLGRY